MVLVRPQFGSRRVRLALYVVALPLVAAVFACSNEAMGQVTWCTGGVAAVLNTGTITAGCCLAW